MPVTFTVAKHEAESVPEDRSKYFDASKLLENSCSDQWDVSDKILQSFLGSGPQAKSKEPLLSTKSGLVSTVIEAYCRHHALVLRPDDIWLSILNQFNYFVNAHAEELRNKFVAHEGRQELVVSTFGDRHTTDFGPLALQMTREMDKRIVDKEVRDWLLPNFSTTSPSDTVAAAVVMMATMKEYFKYKFMLMCGIPRITLEGEKSDWEEILRRAAKLKEYGEQPTAWYTLLEPILTRFIRTFDSPGSKENVDFWQTIVHYEGGGSQIGWLAGWITAFCVFNSKGQWNGIPLGKKPDVLGTLEDIKSEIRRHGRPTTMLTIDGACYHIVTSGNIPQGYAEVDVKLDDNGEELDAVMVAGLVASRISDSGDTKLSKTGIRDVIAPVSGWWICTKRKDGKDRGGEEIKSLSSSEILAAHPPMSTNFRSVGSSTKSGLSLGPFPLLGTSPEPSAPQTSGSKPLFGVFGSLFGPSRSAPTKQTTNSSSDEIMPPAAVGTSVNIFGSSQAP